MYIKQTTELIQVALHLTVLRPIEYHMNLAAYFFVLWQAPVLLIDRRPSDISYRTCRASLVMAPGRLVYNTYWRNMTPLFWLISYIFLLIGAAFTALAIRFCGIDRNCSGFETCFCNLDHRVILCALIGRHVFSSMLIDVLNIS